MVVEVAMRGTEYAATDLLTPEVTMAMAADPSKGLAMASLEIALAMPSLHRPASPSPLLASGGPPLDDDVVQQFDATHRLSELTAAWGNLATFATSFGEKLQVSFSEVLSLDVRLSSVLMSCFSLSFCSVFFS